MSVIENANVAILTETDDMPAPMAREGYYGLAGDFCRLLEPETEASPVALLINFLITSGVMIGRGAFAVAGGRQHFPIDFAVLVGDSGRGRKGTASSHTLAVVNRVQENFSRDHVLSGLSSGEGLISGIQKGKELGVQQFLGYLPEFGSLLTCARREGNTISSVLRQIWDGDPLRVLTKTEPLSVADYLLGLVGHVTDTELVNGLSSTELTNGFTNRFLLPKVRRSKFLPEGGEDVDTSVIVTRLHRVLEAARNRGRVRRNDEARELWASVYQKLADQPKGLKGSLCSRAEAHVLRLSLTYALLDGAGEIQVQHLQGALAVWDYCERSIASIFAGRLGDPEAEKILASVKTGAKTISELHAVFGRNRTSEWLLAKLAAMMKAGYLIETIKECDRKTVQAWDKKR
jgi:hypothetical protein